MVGILGIITVLGCFSMMLHTIVFGAPAPRPPVEIDPTARVYTIRLIGYGNHSEHVKDPVFHQNGGVTFKNSAGKEVIFGPAVQWSATQE